MKKIDTPLVFEGKGSKNKLPSRGKMFGYQVLGFGAGGKVSPPIDVDYLVVAGGASGGSSSGGGGAGGYRTSFPGGTKITIESGS